ncbi:hypothetical protein [Silvimonas sp.]|uniref:hypothetical protein n=1 Tax=Silvimonas sp. TaxID=2650811 RepID=UPI002843BEFC|nr:hypothetical protein [Silvimonas sp.]MDR3428200.1 hypothetical protein [Silvimonas sp.]
MLVEVAAPLLGAEQQVWRPPISFTPSPAEHMLLPDLLWCLTRFIFDIIQKKQRHNLADGAFFCAGIARQISNPAQRNLVGEFILYGGLQDQGIHLLLTECRAKIVFK